MASTFPTSLDNFTNPTVSDYLNSTTVPHATQHADLNDAVEALEAKVGVDSSAVATSLDYKVAQLEAGATADAIVAYADLAARTAANPSPSEGDVSWQEDTNRFDIYNGSAWVEVGRVQVVSTTVTNTFSASLAAGADTAITGLSATITPTNTANKILIMVDVHMSDQSDDYGRGAIRIYRGATSIGEGGLSSPRTSVFASSIVLYANGINIMNIAGTYLDSPSTTSATTYTVHAVNAWTSTKTIRNNRGGAEPSDESATRPSSTITLMEVSA